MIELFTEADSLVLDFFAGSSTTAHATLDYNRSDGGSRRFIMVQIAEPIDTSAETGKNAERLGLHTIADIGKERIRRAIEHMDADEQGQLDLRPDEDLGFKVFKLAPSTFRRWQPPQADTEEGLDRQLSYFDRGLEDGADPLHVIYEVILKEGYSLNAHIEPLDMPANQVYRVSQPEADAEERFFYVCLDDHVQDATLDALHLDKDTVFICLDTALDDSQKVNLAMQCLLKVI
jgi:adenine-specific DNA-methyltransferase